MKLFLMIFYVLFAAVPLFSSELILAENGKTAYQIVTSSRTAKDEWNARFLRWYLKERTGADFPVVRQRIWSANRPSIFIGVCPPANVRWGTPPLTGLQNGEWLVASRGKDIFLLGKGFDADFDAVMDFIFTELDQKWYLRNPPPKVIRQNRLALKPFHRKGKWAFKMRLICNSRGYSDYFRGNTGSALQGWIYRTIRNMPERYPLGFAVSLINGETDPVIQPETFAGSYIHNLFYFIPPGEKAKDFEWLPRSHYFKTHPEFFSMDELGRRVETNQLCLSGKAVRQELLKNTELYFDAMGTDNLEIGYSYMDRPYKACHCPECKALEKKYGTPGAAMFEFTREAGLYMKKYHPKTVIKCSLYYENLTLLPPKVKMDFPENIRFIFCPIENAINRPWDYPKNKKRFQQMVPWCAMSDNVQVMLYALGRMQFLPFCNTEMVMETIQYLHKIGVKGIFYEYAPDIAGFGDDYPNFGELDLYLFYQLMKKPDLDLAGAIQEFIQANYGKAAPIMSRYYRELHDASCKDNPRDFRWNNEFNFFKGNFAYLTLERLRRWSGMFDEMVKLEPKNHLIRNQRVAVDCAVYGRWAELAEKYPDYFKNPEIVRARIGSPKGTNAFRVKEYLKECEDRLALTGVKDKKDGWKQMKSVSAQYNFLISRGRDASKNQDYDAAIQDMDSILNIKGITPAQKSMAIYSKGYYLSRQHRYEEADKLFRETLKKDQHTVSMIWEINYIYVPILIALKKNDEVFDALDAMKRTGRQPKYTSERIKMVEKLGLKRSETAKKRK